MKVIAINGSPNKKGNTFYALTMVDTVLIENNDAGKQVMRVLGKNIAWLLKMKEAIQGTIELPQSEKKIATSFIR